MCQSRLETRGPLRGTCATSYSQIQSRRKWKQLAWTCAHLRMWKSHAQRHNHTHTHTCLCERQGQRVSVFSHRWRLCLGQRVSLDSKLTTVAKREKYDLLPLYLVQSMTNKENWNNVTLCETVSCVRFQVLYKKDMSPMTSPKTQKKMSIIWHVHHSLGESRVVLFWK